MNTSRITILKSRNLKTLLPAFCMLFMLTFCVFHTQAGAALTEEEKQLFADFLADEEWVRSARGYSEYDDTEYDSSIYENIWISLVDVTGDGHEELAVCWNTLANGYGDTYFYHASDHEIRLVGMMGAGGTVTHPGYSTVSGWPYVFTHDHMGTMTDITLYMFDDEDFCYDDIERYDEALQGNVYYTFSQTLDYENDRILYYVDGEEVSYEEYADLFGIYLGDPLPWLEGDWKFGWDGYNPIATLDNTPENRLALLGYEGDWDTWVDEEDPGELYDEEDDYFEYYEESEMFSYADAYISFSVPEMTGYIIEQRNAEYGLAYIVRTADVDGDIGYRQVNAAVSKIDLSLLAGVAEQEMDCPGFEALFQNTPDIYDVTCVEQDGIYEFAVSYTTGGLDLTDYYKFIGIDPSTGLCMCLHYRNWLEGVYEDGVDWDSLYKSFYNTFFLQTSIDVCAQAHSVPVPKTLYAYYMNDDYLQSYLLSAARVGRAYQENTLPAESAVLDLDYILSMISDYDDIEPYYMVNSLRTHIENSQTESAEIATANIIVMGNLDSAQAADTAEVLDTDFGYGQDTGSFDDQSWVPGNAIWYWSENMMFTYTGSWYDSPNGFSVYMPTTWIRKSITPETLAEGIELQLSDPQRGISLSIYCGDVSYEPTVQGICDYLIQNVYQNIRYAVCNGSLYAVQYDSPTTPERLIAFPNASGQVVTLAVYCENQEVREAFAADMFASIFG